MLAGEYRIPLVGLPVEKVAIKCTNGEYSVYTVFIAFYRSHKS